jgi:hypothetical protein
MTARPSSAASSTRHPSCSRIGMRIFILGGRSPCLVTLFSRCRAGSIPRHLFQRVRVRVREAGVGEGDEGTA